MKLVKKIFSIFCTIFFVLSTIFLISNVSNRGSNKPNDIFGYYVFVVVSDSMDPTLKVNDIFLSVKTDEIEEGDIITFLEDDGPLKGELITHRVETIDKSGEEYIYYCRGDKEGAPLDNGITKDQIVGKYVTIIPGVSWLYRVMSTGIGFFLIIILPISAIFITEIIDLIKKLKKNDEEDKKQNYLDELKDQIKKELSKENE